MCPVINDSPHHAPNSCTPPGRGYTGRYLGRRANAIALSSFPVSSVAARSAAAVVAVSDSSSSSFGPGGWLKKLFALTVRESRYHGGRKRRKFAVALEGVIN